MCQKVRISKCTFSPIVSKLAKITIVLTFFCFAECATDRCVAYGHACWGAHGKRDGGRARIVPFRAEDLENNPNDNRLFLARLFQIANPSDFKQRSSTDVDILNGNQPSPIGQHLVKDNALDTSKSYVDTQDSSDQDLIPDSSYQDDLLSQHLRSIDKLRLLDYLKKNAAKIN